MKLFSLLLLITLTSPLGVGATNCVNLIGHCEYYECLNREFVCKKKNYLNNFAYNYCYKYQVDIAHKVDSRTQKWLHDVRICLQEEIEKVDFSKDLTCKSLKAYAFKTHSDCYTRTGFCELNGKDQFLVIKAMAKEIFRPLVIKEAREIMKACKWIKQNSKTMN